MFIRKVKSRVIKLLILCTVFFIIYIYRKSEKITKSDDSKKYNWRNLSESQIKKMSILGRRLYLNEDIGKPSEKNFTIHVWKNWNHIIKRFIRRYTDHDYDYFEGCSVRNCRFTHEDKDVINADAVFFHLAMTREPPKTLPRRPEQIYVWLSDESPKAVFHTGGHTKFEDYTGVFNWSMSYRMDSDVPVPYGRTVLLPENETPKLIDIKDRKKDIVLLLSHCFGANGRYEYVKNLKKYLDFDLFGNCGIKDICPGHYKKNCDVIDNYKIYLAFENNNCDDYISEKLWWNALEKGNIPVVMGTNRSNYEQHLPPNSFIHIKDFNSPKELADHLKYLVANPKELEKYHEWRKSFKVINEHGYFGTPVFHFCRLCEALNYNTRSDLPKNADLLPFFSSKEHCYSGYKPTD